jgi:SSS family solute:Na+ symporter
MDGRLLIIYGYLLLMIFIGFVFQRKAKENRVEFYLAGRNLSKFQLFFTMAATNFSAFTIFGFSGTGYRIGYSFYPVMGFGTAFMALSFIVIGKKIFILSKSRGYITPSDYIRDRYNSQFLKLLFSFVMIVFTLPYIAIQAVASGKSLNSLIGIPYTLGALLITSTIVFYVILGGLRSGVLNDIIQGFMMIVFTLVAFAIIAQKSGGFVALHRTLQGTFPGHFSRPGTGATMGPGIWAGYMLLWFFADPMFPQLFQRFMVARDEGALNGTIVLYPLITTALFFLTVSIGVMGRGTFPDLPGKNTDSIFPLLLGAYASPLLGTLLLTGGLAALMSTMDSQLLTIASMITVDFFGIKKKGVLIEKLTVLALGAIGFLIALSPPETIFDFINKTTFNGCSVLAIPVIGGLYMKRANKYGAAASILLGEGMVVAYYFNRIRLPGIHPIIPIMAVTAASFIVVSALTAQRDGHPELVFTVKASQLPWFAVFGGFFIAANDFWNWDKTPLTVLGLPLWVWYFAVLGGLLSLCYKRFLKNSSG